MKRYNGKVRFLESDINFTAGKIYEIKDGKIANDRGEKFPLYDEFWNFEQVKEYFTANGQYDKQGILVEEYNPSTLKKVYISGPITGTKDYLEKFEDIETALVLVHQGVEVINPAKVNANLPESTTWEEYMRMSLCMLSMCDGIYMMEGWQQSRGANLEYAYAKGMGITVL
mgnify:FL=1